MPSNKAVATVEMIVHSAVGKGGGADEAGFDATLQFDGLTDAESMAAAAADKSGGDGQKGTPARRRKKKMAEQPQYRMDDLEFLQQLMQEDVVKESDVKDIVGDGIRFLNELSTEAEAEAVANASPKRNTAAVTTHAILQLPML